VLPIYPLTAGLSNASVVKAVEQALALCDPPAEILPPQVRQAYGILPAERAYRAIHAPVSMEEADMAKKRLIFEEFFVFSAGLALMRASRAMKKTPPYEDLELTPFLQALPFTLTGAQRRAIDEIASDLRRGAPMNRLVQGDVGSGKTMVAAAAAYFAVKNGHQAALMAPTEILAEQHFASLQKLLTPLGIRVTLLTGSLTPKQKREVRENIARGEYDLIMVDAYRDVTIPFQMSSVEFFSEVSDHLREDGVMVVNLNMYSSTDKSLDKYICDTVAKVFSTVYVADSGTNRMVFASNNTKMVENFKATYPKEGHALSYNLNTVASKLSPYVGGNLILTDDKAPVELLGMQVIDEMIMDELAYYKNLFKGMSISEILDYLQ